MTYLPRLRDQVIEAAGPRRRRRCSFAILGAGALAIAVTSGALAATGVIGIGTPLAPSPHGFASADPNRGPGTIVPSTVRLLALRVPDPAGGPPWGMRVVGTTRGVGCIQVGRVVDGRLGTLGQDGVAGDDGRFHELSPKDVDPADCQPLDAAGTLFATVLSPAALASGPSATRVCLPPGERVHGRTPCPERDVRKLQYGLLGPQAASVTYAAGGRTRTTPVSEPEGAFLIVERNRTRYGGTSPSAAPVVGLARRGRHDYPLRGVAYRDGSRCPAGADAQVIVVCPLKGYRASPTAKLTSAQLAQPLTVRRNGSRITISFAAPVAVTNASSVYALEARFAGVERCHELVAVATSDHDVAAGAPVALKLSVPRFCHGRVSGTVRFQSPPGLPGTSAGTVVGTFKLRGP